MAHRHSLADLVPDAAAQRPEAIAAVCDDQELTWGQLEHRVSTLAAALVEVGVGRGDRVGIHLHKSIESLVAVHGILRAGAAYVPIDPMAPTSTVSTIVEDCGIDVIITHELKRAGLTRAAAAVPMRAVIGLDGPLEGPPEQGWFGGGDGPVTMSWDEVTAMEPTGPVPILGDDLAYVMYTSGSTGTPKGIMHTHRSGLAYATMSSALYQLSPEDRVANFSPLHFDMSTFEILAGVAAGSRVVLIPEPYLRLPASLAEYIEQQRCTTLYTVPSLFQQLLSRGGLADRDLSAVRWVLPAGEVFPPEPLRELLALLPNARFSNVYGPAEVNQCTYFHFDGDHYRGDGSEHDDLPLPIGYASPDAELLILDEADRPVAGTDQGQLLVRTSTMMAGYWNRPDLDDRGFFYVDGPGGLRQRWYRTGDIVSRREPIDPKEPQSSDPLAPGRVGPDDCLLYFGRQDNQVKIRGNRVELEMVEAAVGSLEGIEQAVVGVRTVAGGDSQLVARYIPAPPPTSPPTSAPASTEASPAGDPADRTAWRRDLAGRLPPYAVPGVLESVESFPLTPSGKIDRRTVRAAIAAES